MKLPAFRIGLILVAALLISRTAECDSPGQQARVPNNDDELKYWLKNMSAHRFGAEEMSSVLGLPVEAVKQALEKHISNTANIDVNDKTIRILPYPGGRHPRIGFLEGAIDPQRETKVSIFPPWKDGGYLVLDLPEAVWHHVDGKRELLYLAHTHVLTIWDKQNIHLDPLEWHRDSADMLSLTRELPNKVKMISKAKVIDGAVRLQFSVTNSTDQPLTGLHIQMCGMLKGLTDFTEQTNDNKVFAAPFAACRSKAGNRWVVLGFDHCVRAWGNSRCPCLHSDPQVPDCAPGETQSVHGWVSFFEGEEIGGELKRLESIAFKPLE